MSELEFDGKKAKLSYNSEINFKMSSLNVKHVERIHCLNIGKPLQSFAFSSIK
jgi:hypothetical protein